MQWDELVAEFTALGGIVENIRLGTGRFGRGVFPIDPAKPVRFMIPLSLMVPVGAAELRDGALIAKPGYVGERETEFFNAYQRHFGWSAGARDESFGTQYAWHDLPAELIQFIKTMGILDDPDRRFVEPTEEHLLLDYIGSRGFMRPDGMHFIPVIDLLNHRSSAPGFHHDGAVGVVGTFADEVVVRYNNIDSIGIAISYGFSDYSIFANSIALTVDLTGGRKLTVARAVNNYQERNGLAFPQIVEEGNNLHLAFLLLGNISAPDTPRAIFREVMKPYLSIAEADRYFDGISHFNRMRFLNLVRLTRNFNDPLAVTLEDAALNQLEALAACIGAREF